MNCFYCGKNIDLSNEKKINIPLDKPYANLFVHRAVCYDEILNIGLEVYLNSNIDKIYAYAKIDNNIKTKRK